VGDYVKNEGEQFGTVTRVHATHGGHEHVSLRWDDGDVDLPLRGGLLMLWIPSSRISAEISSLKGQL